MTSPVLTNNLDLHDMATHILPQYEADEGALKAAQLKQIKQQELQSKKNSLRCSLFNLEPLIKAVE